MSTADEVQQKLDDVWKKVLPLMLRRLEVIERAHQALAQGQLPESLRVEGVHEAHKLAGSLGVFAIKEGSELALQVEQVLSSSAALDSDRLSELDSYIKTLKSKITSR
jgi:HPt (histidine-containing phosphotransfer) domain-containing protein